MDDIEEEIESCVGDHFNQFFCVYLYLFVI